jgi:3-isopropylmalate/(R)-2-methylmalate dehydratase large subunit
MGQTISQKILARACGRDHVTPGEIVFAKPDLLWLYDWHGFDGLMRNINIDSDKVALNIDHYFSPSTEGVAKLHQNFRNTVKKYDIKKFYDVNKGGIGFHLFAEEGHIRPGMMVMHIDPHVSTMSALGAYCVGVGGDVMAGFLTGEIWLRVPETLKVTLTGSFKPGVTSRDLFERLLHDLGPDGAQGMVIEFCGPAICDMGIDARLVLCNSVQYLSAETAIIAADDVVVDYLKDKTDKPFEVVTSDADAVYAREVAYDVSTLEPMVVTPPDVFYVKSVSEVVGKKIQQAMIGTCAGGRLEDLRVAAQIVKGKKIHPDVRFLVFPITPKTHRDASHEGLIDILVEAGAMMGPGTCGPCFGGFAQLLPGEVCLSTGTMNVPGRMGSTEAEIYMANAACVTASALTGAIADPRPFLK